MFCVCVDMSKHVSAEVMKRCGSDPCVKKYEVCVNVCVKDG